MHQLLNLEALLKHDAAAAEGGRHFVLFRVVLFFPTGINDVMSAVFKWSVFSIAGFR